MWRRSTPATRGRQISASTSAAKAVRSSTTPPGPRSSNSDLAIAPPTCTEATPATTSSGAGTARSADTVDLPEGRALDEEDLGAVVERGGGLVARDLDGRDRAAGLELLRDLSGPDALLARARAPERRVLVAQRQPAAEHVDLLRFVGAKRELPPELYLVLRRRVAAGRGAGGGRGGSRRGGVADRGGGRLVVAAAAQGNREDHGGDHERAAADRERQPVAPPASPVRAARAARLRVAAGWLLPRRAAGGRPLLRARICARC